MKKITCQSYISIKLLEEFFFANKICLLQIKLYIIYNIIYHSLNIL